MKGASCDRIRDLLPDAEARRLSAEEARTVESHLAGCAECREEAALIRTMLRHPAQPPPELEARLRAVARRPGASSIARLRRPALLAATVAAALVGGAGLLHELTNAPLPEPPAVRQQVATEAPAPAPVEGRSLLLPLPGSGDDEWAAADASLNDLSEAELQSLLKELDS